MKPRI